MVNENVVHSTMRSLAMLVAKFWADNIRPTAFDTVFYLPGVRVRFTVEEFKRVDDTQPMKRIDEDEGIAD